MPFDTEKFSSGYKGKKKPKKETAGPYRGQSSVPSIRKEANPYREHHGEGKAEHREHKAQRKARKARRIVSRSLKHSKASLIENESPGQAEFFARGGVKPPKKLSETHPTAYRTAHRIASEVKHPEGLTPDPLAEFVISTAATAGLGAGAKLAASGLEGASGKLLASGGSRLASSGATAAEEATEKGVRALAGRVTKAASKKAERVKTAPARTARRIKETPKRVREAPGKAKRAATTSEGRRAAAKGAAGSAKRHPVRTGYGGAVVLPEGVLPGDATKRARAALTGTADALLHHPAETLKTTARALPAAITGPAALLGAAGESIVHGTPKPLEKTASEQAKGVAQIASDTFSGDPKKAEMAARKEGSLAFLTPVPALGKTKIGKGIVKEGRDLSSATRRAVATTDKLPAKDLRNRIRHAPKGTPEYAFGITARHHERKATAVERARSRNAHAVEAANHRRALEKAATKAEHQFPGSNAIHQFLAEHPIQTAEQIHQVRAWVAANSPKDKEALASLDWLEKNPDYLKSKERQTVDKALEENAKTLPANEVGKGERARLMQMGDVLGHTRPEDMSPVSGFNTRGEAWGHVEALDKHVLALRRQARAKLDQAKVLKGAEKQAATQEGKALFAQAREVQGQARGLVKQLDPFTLPGQSIDRSARTAYNGAMLAHYKQAVEQGLAKQGYGRPIWTRHGNPAGEGIGTPFPTAAGNVEHMRSGALAKAGELDRSLEGLVRGTIESTRHRAANKEFGRWMPQQSLTYKWDGKVKHNVPDSQTFRSITSPKSKDNPNGGQFDPKSVVRLPVREFQRAVEDPFMSPEQKMAELGKILDEAVADKQGRAAGHAPSVLLPREIVTEAKYQITPSEGGVLNSAARASSRLLLGTNPAWEASQVFAEGIPLLISKPSLAWKFRLYQKFRNEYAAKHPGDALSARATAGASPIRAGVNLQPHDIQASYTPQTWADGAKGLTRGKTARELLSFAKLESLGRFDVRRQNEYRTLQYMAEADRKHLRTFHDSLTGLFDHEARLSRKFKTREELHRWLETTREGKAAQRKIEDYVDNMQGNWTAFTRYEQKFAPAVLFYPFIRYSLRWPLWAFPKEHPIRATTAYLLGQANANQLEKLIGGPLTNPIGYAFPVYNTGSFDQAAYEKAKKEGATDEQAKLDATHAVLPGGSRISPGQSNITQALQSGNPANILSSLNPLLGAGITATTGIEPFTGRQVQERGLAAIEGLLDLPRPASLRVLPGGKNLAETILPGQERSATSKAYGTFDPLREERSFLAPGIPQTGEQFAGTERFSKDEAAAHGEGNVPYYGDSPLFQKILYGHNGGPNPNPRARSREIKEAVKTIHAAEGAANRNTTRTKPFFPPSKNIPKAVEEEIREAFENAYLTGPNAPTESSSQYGGGEQYGSGGQYSSSGQYSGAGQYK